MSSNSFQVPFALYQGPLEEYNILRSADPKEYDELVYLTAKICNAPVAFIKVLEKNRTWIKSSFGIEKNKIPNNPDHWLPIYESRKFWCTNQTNGEDSFPYGFVAGVPLITAEDNVIGALLVLKEEGKEISRKDIDLLQIMAHQIILLLEHQKQNLQLVEVQRRLKEKYLELEKFASVVSHDIKSPLANIISLTEMLKEENNGSFSEESAQYLDYLSQSSNNLRNYVDGILSFYRSDHILDRNEQDVELCGFFKPLAAMFEVNQNVKISYPRQGVLHKVNKAALTQIFLNLLSNSLKYNSKNERWVKVTYEEMPSYYHFEVKDNGDGIPENEHKRIFELFATLDKNDRYGNTGSGIGLATVKKILDHLGGSIEVESKLNEGSNFKFRIKRK